MTPPAPSSSLLLVPLVALLFATPAAAGPQQPNGASIPALPGCNGGKTTGLAAEFACICTQPGICNQGAACPGGSPSCDPGTNGTCETTTWHNVNDNPCIPSNTSGLDPQADAKLVPETFHPTCPQTFTVITRGTAMFKNAFGWYNVTGQKPAGADLHLMLACDAGAGESAVLDLKAEQAYAGGDVGFFLVTPESQAQPGTCDGGDCCATLARAASGHGYVYYSERKYNPDFVGDKSWIHLLIYESQIAESKYYFAWEDSNKSPNNDFTDLLTSVTGIQCSGAGVACDTGGKGLCAQGITACSAGKLSCSPIFEAGAEQCNGLDDDCDGAVDDAATCPTPGEVCWHGSCVPTCSKGEFSCPPEAECDSASGLCVAAGCVGMSCDAGTVCRGGQCVAPCEGVLCPHGQTCVADACVDLCKGVACGGGEVCRDGKCFAGCAACDGLSCAAPGKCDVASGSCVDPSCPGGCPPGSFCSGGQCKPDCDGAKCPGDQLCKDGQCAPPGGPGTGGSGGFGFGGDMGQGGGAASGQGGAGGGDFNPLSGKACSCDVAGGAGDVGPGAAALGLVLAALRRRGKRR